jgi:hypothetical protein
MMNLYVFGNGNMSFEDFKTHYEKPLLKALEMPDSSFSLCDFRGTDTLTMEFLKCLSGNVTIYHVGERPRYFPDKYKTKAGEWRIVGGFPSDEARDRAAIDACTHYLAIDFNSDAKRKSGTQKNIELCESLGKIRL